MQPKAGLFVIWISPDRTDIGMGINSILESGGNTRSMYYEVSEVGSKEGKTYDDLILVANRLTGYDEGEPQIRIVQDELAFHMLEGATFDYWKSASEYDLKLKEAEHALRAAMADGSVTGKNEDERYGQLFDQLESLPQEIEAALEAKGDARAEMELAKVKVRLLGYMQRVALLEEEDD